MPEQRKPELLLERPPQLPYQELPPSWLHKLLGGVMGDQEPGDLPSAIGAALPFLPLGKLLRSVKGFKQIKPAANVGDQLLREHVLNGQGMREFLPVGEEGAAQTADPWQAILDITGKPKPSPKGSGPKSIAAPKGPWPKEEDLNALKAKLRKPPNGK